MWTSLKLNKETHEKWDTIQGTNQVMEYVVPWCHKHFQQATETPFATPGWDGVLDVLREGNKVEEILNGEFIPNTQTEEMTRWIQALKLKDGVNTTTELDVSLEEFKEFIQKVKSQRGPLQVEDTTDIIKS